ncbi:MAG: FlaD/FlaE family flagellar protein [Candidatus Thermoplasmatota archaeon]|nr:FlaD/FlaE family flagellar protein [Candidatus Thermoplasmatota archaeon]
MRFNLRRKKKEEPSVETFEQNFVPQQEFAPPQEGSAPDILADRVDMLDSSVSAIRGWVEDARNRITALEGTVNDTVVPLRRDLEDVKKDVSSMDEKLQQLMALYEVISTQYNPFIETSAAPPPQAENGSKEEKEIEQLLRSVAPEEFATAPGENVVEMQEGYETLEEPESAELAPITEEEFGVDLGGGYELGYEPKAVLGGIPDTYSSNAFTIKLLEFLISKIGRKNLPDLLEYYESIGWIGKDARKQLLEMASGVSVSEGFSTDWKLSAADNLKVLQFIQEIRGKPIRKSELEEIERKAEKIKGV